MKSNQKKTGKVRRILAAVLSVMMLATSGFTTAWAEEAGATVELTAKHYPGVARIIAASEGIGGTLYWKPAEAGAITSTKLYKLSNGEWSGETDVTGVNSASIDDAEALYKIVTAFEDGAISEYVIQKNESGQKATVLMPIGAWHGSTTKYYVGVTGADSHGGEHALRAHTWDTSGNNRFWVRLINTPGTFVAGKKYRATFWYRSDYNYGLSLRIDGKEINGTNNSSATVPEWKEYKREFVGSGNTNDVYAFSLNLNYCNDAWIDDIEIYELDESGNPIGENIMVGGDFESSNADGTAPNSGIANVQYDVTDNGVMLDWAKGTEAIGTRVYNEDGRLVAELGDATELPLTGLTDGESYTYELRSVFAGGYECSGKTVTFTAGAAEKPEISEYYPINLIARNKAYDDNGTSVKAVKLMWMNPNLNGINLTNVKIYDISGNEPVEKTTVEAIDLRGGYDNSVHIKDTASTLSNLYRMDFAYDDGTNVSFTTQTSGVKWGNNDYWSLQSSADGNIAYGRKTNESYSGDASLLMHRYEWMGSDYILYEGAKDVFESGKQYEISFRYKTLLANNDVTSGDRYAFFRFMGEDSGKLTAEDVKFNCNDSYDWQKVTKRVTAGSGTVMGFYLETDAAVWVDDLSIKLVDSTTGEVTGDNLILDGSFEGTQGMSEITDATYVGTDGGVKINWTRTDNSVYGTHVYLDGVRIAEVYGARQDAEKPYVNSTLPITGLENGKKYTITLKDVCVSGRELNGAYITVIAGEGNGTDLYMPDAVNVKYAVNVNDADNIEEICAGVNLAWYNPWNAPSKISFYDVTAKKAVEVKQAVVLDANGAEVEARTPELSLEAGKYNYVTVVDSKGTLDHTYKLTFEFADGTTREYYVNAQDITGERVAAWQNAYACKPIAHFAYTNDAIGNTAYSFGRYYWNYADMSTNTPFYYRGLDSALEVGKTYRVAFKMKGKALDTTNTVAIAGNTATFKAVQSKNWLQYYVDIPVTTINTRDTRFSVNGANYTMIDDFEVYELDENGIPVAQVEGWGGDFENDLGVQAVTDAKAETLSGSVKLSWTLPEIPEGDWDESQLAGLTAIGANVYSDGIKIASIKGTELELADLEPGKDYTFEVRAINVAGYEAKGVSVNIKIEAGVIVSGFDIYDDSTNETIDTIGGPLPSYTVKATVSNLAESDRTVMIAYAMYDENGKLLTIKQTSKTIYEGAENEEISAQYIEEVDFYLPSDVSYAKIFLWDMTDNMKPIGDTAVLPRVE